VVDGQNGGDEGDVFFSADLSLY